MKNIIVGAGTTFDFTVPIPEPILAYENIEVELFVDVNRPIRFSYTEKYGYDKLIDGSTEFEIAGKLRSIDSLKLKGCLFMKLNCFKEIGENENIGYSASFGVGDYRLNTDGTYTQISQLILK